MTVLQTMIANSTGAQRARLSDAAARLSVLVTGLLFDGGQAELARRWRRTARQAAADSYDAHTAALVQAWEIVDGCYDRSHNPMVVLGLSDEAVNLAAGRVSPATEGLHAGRAQLLAMLGRDSETRTEMRKVTDITAQLPEVMAGMTNRSGRGPSTASATPNRLSTPTSATSPPLRGAGSGRCALPVEPRAATYPG